MKLFQIRVIKLKLLQMFLKFQKERAVFNKPMNLNKYYFLGFLFLGSCTLGCWVRKIHPKNAPNDKLITPIKVIIKEDSEDKLGAIVNPITIPRIPVPKNIIIKTFSRKGLMYFIYKFLVFFNIIN